MRGSLQRGSGRRKAASLHETGHARGGNSWLSQVPLAMSENDRSGDHNAQLKWGTAVNFMA
jgi:hypothetical protein